MNALEHFFFAKDCFDYNTDYWGNDVGKSVADNPKACQQLCAYNSKCNYWTLNLNTKTCIFKSAKTGIINNLNHAISGPKYCLFGKIFRL